MSDRATVSVYTWLRRFATVAEIRRDKRQVVHTYSLRRGLRRSTLVIKIREKKA